MPVSWLVAALALLAVAPETRAQPARPHLDRLSPDVLDVRPPSDRVSGEPGGMIVQRYDCPTLSMDAVRRRIVDLAAQEWGFFGFRIRDETAAGGGHPPPGASPATGGARLLTPRAWSWRLSPGEAARVATSVAGYWAVTPQAAMMISRQNGAWNGPRAGRGDPWSAAFVSWIMCEAGLGSARRFQRAIAHHAYIDQAIRARDGRAPDAAFVAHDIGAEPIVPGDLLCAARRPVYRTIADRRRQLGVGARTHCDVVVQIDEPGGRIFAIGGNVRGTVSLKLLPAARRPSGHLQPSAIGGARPMFAHMKLRAAPIEAHALENSPTIRTLACRPGFQAPSHVTAIVPAAGTPGANRC